MTNALCFSCGHVKFGALIPCNKCRSEPIGNVELAVVFTDHYLARSTLEQLGKVVATINSATEDEGLRFYSFIYYVSENHPVLLTYTPPPSAAEPIKSLLATVELPSVTLTPVGRGLRDHASDSEETGKSQQRPWWQFWKRGP